MCGKRSEGPLNTFRCPSPGEEFGHSLFLSQGWRVFFFFFKKMAKSTSHDDLPTPLRLNGIHLTGAIAVFTKFRVTAELISLTRVVISLIRVLISLTRVLFSLNYKKVLAAGHFQVSLFETLGAFHSTKITGSNFRNFRWSNGTRPTASQNSANTGHAG